MAYFLLGLLVLIAVLLLSRWVATADPARLVPVVRWTLIVLVVAALAALAWAGRFLLAAYVLPFLIPALIRGGIAGLGRRSPGGPSSQTPGRGGSSSMSREDAYRLVQSAALRAIDGDGGFRANLEASAEVRSHLPGGLDAIFDPRAFLQHTDLAFRRLGLVQATATPEEVAP